jgi:hypothetical protein
MSSSERELGAVREPWCIVRIGRGWGQSKSIDYKRRGVWRDAFEAFNRFSLVGPRSGAIL